MSDDNMPAEIWAARARAFTSYYDAATAASCDEGFWYSSVGYGHLVRYIRPPRWRTVEVDGMPEAGREVMIKRHSVFLGATHYPPTSRCWVVANGWTTPSQDADCWAYLDEVLALFSEPSRTPDPD